MRVGAPGASLGMRSLEQLGERFEGLENKILGVLKDAKCAIDKRKRKASPILKEMESLGQEFKNFNKALKVGEISLSVKDEGVSPPAGFLVGVAGEKGLRFVGRHRLFSSKYPIGTAGVLTLDEYGVLMDGLAAEGTSRITSLLPLGTACIPLPVRHYDMRSTGPGAYTLTRIWTPSQMQGVETTTTLIYSGAIDGRPKVGTGNALENYLNVVCSSPDK